MRVELLVVPDCPNERLAYTRLRQALDEAGRADTAIEVVTLTQDSVATAEVFAGSPTVVIDGVDPFGDLAVRGPELSCRLYSTGAGPTGAPELDALRHAVAVASQGVGMGTESAPVDHDA